MADMTYHRTERLRKGIVQHLEAYPEDAPALLESVSQGLRTFAQKALTARNAVADNALLCVMATSTPKNLVLSIDAAHYRFPDGNLSNSSSGELKWWKAFLKLAAKGTDDLHGWLRNKGPTYVKWWAEHVQPAIKKGKAT